MYDTVVASIEVDLKDESMFTHRSVVDEVVRMWRNPSESVYEPRLTYWRARSGGHGKLRIEFSIPKMAGVDPLCNPTADDLYRARVRVDVLLISWFEQDLPSINDWQAQRVDYAWNFEPSVDTAQYITLLQGMWLGRMSRHPHPDAEGVVWKSKQPNHRWVKFYNKAREAGSTGTPVLRFEVSNYRRSLDYMCSHWLGCSRSVGDLLQPGRALYVMARIWSRLGLFSSSYHADNGLILKLHQLFGGRAAKAFYALMCISTYGADAHKVHHLLSDNTYYKYKRELGVHDLLVNSDVYLPPLSLPAVEVIKMLKNSVSRDLGANAIRGATSSQKIPPKNWQSWAKILQVSEKSPEIGRFTELLQLSWEQIYGEKTDELGRLPEAERRSTARAAS